MEYKGRGKLKVLKFDFGELILISFPQIIVFQIKTSELIKVNFDVAVDNIFLCLITCVGFRNILMVHLCEL